MAKVSILCRLVTKEGRRSEYIEELRAILEVAQEEVGTEVYIVHEAPSDDVTIFVYELYRDSAAYQAHRASKAHAHLQGRLEELLAVPPEVSFAVPVGGKISPSAIS
jgi:quinol monooxygenase YgiN